MQLEDVRVRTRTQVHLTPTLVPFSLQPHPLPAAPFPSPGLMRSWQKVTGTTEAKPIPRSTAHLNAHLIYTHLKFSAEQNHKVIALFSVSSSLALRQLHKSWPGILFEITHADSCVTKRRDRWVLECPFAVDHNPPTPTPSPKLPGQKGSMINYAKINRVNFLPG